ncbi:MAG: gliding motility-associated C-terminal domain-containing protein [Bacteroidota bacterium]
MSLRKHSSLIMARFYLICMFSLLISYVSLGQTTVFDCLQIEWEQNYGGSDKEWIRSVQQTRDGGYVMVGYSRSGNNQVNQNAGEWDIWVIKTDPLGEIEWDKVLGGSGSDEANTIRELEDGGYIIAGSSTSDDGPLTGVNQGFEDAWVIRLSENGTLVWERNYGGSAADKAEAIEPTPDGGYIVAGYSASFDGDLNNNLGEFDVWIFKIDDNGTLEWSRNYGGGQDDWVFDLTLAADGGYAVAGSSFSSSGNVSSNNGFYDYWMLKVGPTGSLEWEESFGGSSEERAYGICTTQDGGYALAGAAFSSDGDVGGNRGGSDYWIVKTDANGQLLWERNYGGSAEEYARDILEMEDGGFVVGGYVNSKDGDITNNKGLYDYWMIRLDANGDLEWEGSFGGSRSDRCFSLDETADGGFVLGGYALSSDIDVAENFGDWDYWLVKLFPDTLDLFLGADTTLCIGTQLTLDASNPKAESYLWDNNTTDSTFTVQAPGIYWAEIARDNCRFRDSIQIAYTRADEVDLGKDSILCSSRGPVVLDATLPNADGYFWQDGQDQATYEVYRTGEYIVEVEQYGCFIRDSIRVVFSDPILELGPDSLICDNEAILKDVWLPEATYLWQDGSTERFHVIRDSGTYWVQLDLLGCVVSDTFYVDYCKKYRDPCLEIPNAFTPNRDGLNDEFRAVNFCDLREYQLHLYNRWGQRVFSTAAIDQTWDGLYKGQEAPPGVYTYIIDFVYGYEGDFIREQQSGQVMLMR